MKFNDYIKTEPYINSIPCGLLVEDSTVDGIKGYYCYWKDTLLDAKDNKKFNPNTLQNNKQV